MYFLEDFIKYRLIDFGVFFLGGLGFDFRICKFNKLLGDVDVVYLGLCFRIIV